MASPLPFTPGASISLSVTSSTAVGALPTGSGTVFRICNDGTVTVFFKATTVAGTAATTDTPILPGATELFTLDPAAVSIAAITGTGTATLRVTRGEGL